MGDPIKRVNVLGEFCRGFDTSALEGVSLREVVRTLGQVYAAYRSVNPANVGPNSLSSHTEALLSKLEPSAKEQKDG